MWGKKFLEQRPDSGVLDTWEFMTAFVTFATQEETLVYLVTASKESCLGSKTEKASYKQQKLETAASSILKCQLEMLAFKVKDGRETAEIKHKYWKVGRSQAIYI